MRRSLHPCNTESGAVLATPFGPATLTEVQAENTGRNGGCISTFKFCRKDRWDVWKVAVFNRTLIPTDGQWNVIAKMQERLFEDKVEDSKSSQRKSKTEPLQSMIQGLPGAGKTMVITFLVDASSQCLDGLTVMNLHA